MTDEGFIGLASEAAIPGGEVRALLGCNAPILLRPLPREGFRVVGSCYVRGLGDAKALLGELPRPSVIHVKTNSQRAFLPTYYNPTTQESTQEDLRLGTVPEEWEQLEADGIAVVADVFVWFKNILTGEIINSDPQYLPNVLRNQGVSIRTIRPISPAQYSK